jgi:hypothetical protein
VCIRYVATMGCHISEPSTDGLKIMRNFATSTRAREIQGHARADMAVHSALEARDAGLGRLAYDALKWHASKLVPKVYGDKTEVVVAGPNGGPVQSERVVVSKDPMEAMRTYQRVKSGDG